MNVSFDDIYLFTQTVVHGGISAAAEANQLQRSKVSRRLQELENNLGVQLLIRTTRSIELTAHGKRYLSWWDNRSIISSKGSVRCMSISRTSPGKCVWRFRLR